jgi:hypothetical protein
VPRLQTGWHGVGMALVALQLALPLLALLMRAVKDEPRGCGATAACCWRRTCSTRLAGAALGGCGVACMAGGWSRCAWRAWACCCSPRCA